MSGHFSGPMFDPAEDQHRKSIYGRPGSHYNIFATHTPESAIALLRIWFPGGKANEYNLVFFSTSGVHGNCKTLEEIEASLKKHGEIAGQGDDFEYPDDYAFPEVTFSIFCPRTISVTYGNARVTLDDLPWLKKLRQSSWEVFRAIGAPRVPATEAVGL